VAASVTGITVKPPLIQRIKLNLIGVTVFYTSLIILYWQRGNFTTWLSTVLPATPFSFMLDWQLHEWFPTFTFSTIAVLTAYLFRMAYKAKFKEVAPEEFTDIIYRLEERMTHLNKNIDLLFTIVKPALSSKGVELRVDMAGVKQLSTEQQRRRESDKETKQYEEELEPSYKEYKEKLKDASKGGEI